MRWHGPRCTCAIERLQACVHRSFTSRCLAGYVQVRLQQANSPYKTARQVVAAVIEEDGIKGLWKGTAPGVVSIHIKIHASCGDMLRYAADCMRHIITHLADALVVACLMHKTWQGLASNTVLRCGRQDLMASNCISRDSHVCLPSQSCPGASSCSDSLPMCNIR